MKKLLISLILCSALVGCSWEEAEKNAEKAVKIADSAEKVAVSTSFLTGPYGEAAVPILGAISAIATAVAGLARRKTKAVAKAATEAAEEVPGGGQQLVNSAHENGVSKEIRRAYEG
jgi:hypothetical protein